MRTIPPTTRRRATKIAAVLTLLLSTLSRDADASSNGLVVESVNSYPTKGTLYNRVANGNGFINGMTGTSHGGNSWSTMTNWNNSTVWDRDFVDPDRSLDSSSDSFGFDAPGAAISFFSGHGVCDGHESYGSQPCTSSSQCNSPMPGTVQKLPGTCRSGPGLSGGCVYNSDRYIVTESSSDIYGGLVDYSNSYVKWGESATSGGWSGAGTNGGTNMVVLDLSCGVLAPFWVQQLQPAFAGIHFLATIMPTTGDTNDSAGRGAAFARYWQVNPAGAMADAWTHTLNDLPQTDGGSCFKSDYSVGGGHGINGCGCNFIISFDTQARAYNKMKYGNFYTVQDDTQDAISNDSYYWYAICNYDTGTYPWSL